MDNKKDLLHYISRSTIILPIIIVVIALALSPNAKIKDQFIVPTPSITTPSTTPATNSINLKGPFVCNFSYKDSQIEAEIENKKIYAKVVDANEGLSNYLLAGDCLYSWQANTKRGTKTCGLSPLISLFELTGSFSSLPLPIDKTQVNKFIQSCKTTKIKDKEVFNIPKNVVFKTK